MTMSGKNALRKKRFTESLCSGYPNGFSPPGVLRSASGQSDTFGEQILVQHPDVGQIPVPLGEIEAVADHELVRNLEADIADVHLDLAASRLRQKRADLEARRPARLEVPDEIRERQTRIDDVLDNHDVEV